MEGRAGRSPLASRRIPRPSCSCAIPHRRVITRLALMASVAIRPLGNSLYRAAITNEQAQRLSIGCLPVLSQAYLRPMAQ